jgi:DNA invertase Pin-like site-specific DNA recombinase
MSRAVLYLGISTREQTTESRERELRQWAEGLGLEVERVFICDDTSSGSRRDRVAWRSLLAGAHRRDFDVLLIWSLDRLSRDGVGPIVRRLDQLRAAGVRVMSHQESWLDTGGPVGERLVAVFAFLARLERERIGERVRVGQALARAQGVHLGRKPRTVDLEELRERREAGQGWRRIARAMKVPVSTLRGKWHACEKSPYELRQRGPRLARSSDREERAPQVERIATGQERLSEPPEGLEGC